MAGGDDLPDELIEQILVSAWIADDLADSDRWTMVYKSISCLCRRWRSIMLAVKLSNVIIHTPDDILWYTNTSPDLSHISSEQASPLEKASFSPMFSRTHIRTMLTYVRLISVVPDCRSLEVHIGTYRNKALTHKIHTLTDVPAFPSLYHVSLHWPRLLRKLSVPHLDTLDGTAVTTVRKLSLHYPAENDVREFVYCLPILSRVYPGVTTLYLRGPVALTNIAGYFPKLQTIILDTPPLDVANSIEAEMGSVEPSQPPSPSVLWTITAAMKTRKFRALRRIVHLGGAQEPGGWTRVTQACRAYGVTLEFKATY
ncbi:hypothetical protein EIP91_000186 [Steccherinum ochraceum]|uniref:F-box domain-containing protein n=1 Tax=Steccherinum ochraceum TaxID=92696 RepID=A0A4R0RUA7_9APHY|nr:hypothetical protein EIP91_000186 [Steccherinum ochraceum]